MQGFTLEVRKADAHSFQDEKTRCFLCRQPTGQIIDLPVLEDDCKSCLMHSDVRSYYLCENCNNETPMLCENEIEPDYHHVIFQYAIIHWAEDIEFFWKCLTCDQRHVYCLNFVPDGQDEHLNYKYKLKRFIKSE